LKVEERLSRDNPTRLENFAAEFWKLQQKTGFSDRLLIIHPALRSDSELKKSPSSSGPLGCILLRNIIYPDCYIGVGTGIII